MYLLVFYGRIIYLEIIWKDLPYIITRDKNTKNRKHSTNAR